MMKNPEIWFCVSSLNENEGFSSGVFLVFLGISDRILLLNVGVTVVFFCVGFGFICFTFGVFMFCVGSCMTSFGVRFEPLSTHAVNSNMKNSSKVVDIFIIIKSQNVSLKFVIIVNKWLMTLK